MQWYWQAWRQYAEFYGRTSRQGFWMFFLIHASISIFIITVEISLGLFGAIDIGYSVLTLLPQFAITVRRLHDTGRSGYWILLTIIPVIGFIVLIIMLCEQGDSDDNSFGFSPLRGNI